MDDDVEDGNDLAFQWLEAPSIAAQLSIVNSRATLCFIDGIAQDSKLAPIEKLHHAGKQFDLVRFHPLA